MKRFILIIALLTSASILSAQNILSPGTKLIINQHLSQQREVITTAVDDNIETAIEEPVPAKRQARLQRERNYPTRLNQPINNRQSFSEQYAKSIAASELITILQFDVWNPDLSEIEATGASIISNLGNTVVVKAPFDRIEELSSLSEVNHISAARHLRLTTDCMLSEVSAAEAWSGEKLNNTPYTGEGVIVGVVDMGIDFDHMAFRDNNGNTRISRVYCPDHKGTVTLSDGSTISGAEYTTAEAIMSLTALDWESHGTHTTSIAAGTKHGNYGGVAPGAQIVVCPIEDEENLTDATILACIQYIFDYADQEGLPAVVNLSLGDHQGPHDGNTAFCEAINEMAGEGKIVVLSAGNEGDLELHIKVNFQNAGTDISTPQASTLLTDYYYSPNVIDDVFHFYSTGTEAFALRLLAVDATTGEVLASTDALSSDKTIRLSTSALSTYFSGTIEVEFTNDNRSGAVLYVQSRTRRTGKYYLGIEFCGPQGIELHGWSGWCESTFYDGRFTTKSYFNGDSNMSISDMACGDQTISVGSYISKARTVSMSGTSVSTAYGNVGDLSDFSSYGPDMNGKVRPEVSAPGELIVSAINAHDTDTSKSHYVATVTDGTNTYPWATMRGTSMSAPAVSGVIALWLQACPTLSPDDIKEIISQTSVTDDYTAIAPEHWGAGKINALRGLIYINEHWAGIDDVTTDNPAQAAIVYPNPCNGQFRITTTGSDDYLLVEIYNMNGACVFGNTLATIGGEIEINLCDSLQRGVYVVRIVGKKVDTSCRLVVL